MKEYSILIGGEAGEGSKKAGLIIAKFFSSYGYEIYIYEDYQSLIKGGHNFSLIRASKEKTSSPKEKIDFLLALNQDTAEKHQKKLKDKKYIVFNSDKISLNFGIGVPIEKINRELNGIPIMKNTALVAAFGKIIGMEWETIKKILERELPIATELNLKIAQQAYQQTETVIEIEKIKKLPKPLLSGN